MHPDQKRCRPASSFQGSPSDPEDPVLGDISGLGKFYIVCGYTDMHKSIDSCCAIIGDQLNCYFCFSNFSFLRLYKYRRTPMYSSAILSSFSCDSNFSIFSCKYSAVKKPFLLHLSNCE